MSNAGGVMPLYGFVAGDTLGVVVLVRADETFRELAVRLAEAANVRVAGRGRGRIVIKGRVLDPKTTLRSEGLTPLDRVDLVWT
jgi:hypothetical protein